MLRRRPDAGAGGETAAQVVADAQAGGDLTAAEAAELRRELAEVREALAALEAARTPAAEEAARRDVEAAKAELEDTARAVGLRPADVQTIRSWMRDEVKAAVRELDAEYDAADEAGRAGSLAELAAKPDAEPAPPGDPADDPPKSPHWMDKRLFGRKAEPAPKDTAAE